MEDNSNTRELSQKEKIEAAYNSKEGREALERAREMERNRKRKLAKKHRKMGW